MDNIAKSQESESGLLLLVLGVPELRNKLFVGTKLIKNGTISMKVGTIGVW